MTDVGPPGALDRFDVGVPAGTAALAVALAERSAAGLRRLTGAVVAADARQAVATVLLPHLTGDLPRPSPPVPVGRGAVHADLTPDDADAFDRLRAVTGEGDDPETLAAAAQEWRLPVTPYRPLPAPAAVTDGGAPRSHRGAMGRGGEADGGHGGGPVPGRDLRSVRVVDLTAMWAGPLCTALLAEQGMQVATVEPACRRDGLRGSPGMFALLDRGKVRVDLDLRRAEDRVAFEALVVEADLLVESFSARVMGNLGYGPEELRRLRPTLATVSIRAFPAGTPEEHWVAYGQGVHAASGLGLLDGTPRPAGLSYPDPLAGLAAFAEALELLAAPEPGGRREVSLAGAIAPLAHAPQPRPGAGGPAALAELAARPPGPPLLIRAAA